MANKHFLPGQPLTRQPSPRVLIEVPPRVWTPRSQEHEPIFDADLLRERLAQTVPTVAVAESLSRVNLNEWDCVVTTAPPVNMRSEQAHQEYRSQEVKTLHEWAQRYPERLSVVCLIRAGSLEVLDAFPPKAEPQEALPDVAVLRDEPTVGRHLRQIEGLSPELQRVVHEELLPVARSREEHSSFRRWTNPDAPESEEQQETFVVKPFLLGPDDVILAGAYQRGAHASVWLVPADVHDPYPWVVEALREWHLLYPSQFPAIADWHGTEAWRSRAEDELAAERRRLVEEFESQRGVFETGLAELDQRAELAREAADSFHRALLTEVGHELEHAVALTLRHLGFTVVDMDERWPEGDRREDLRVYDDDDPEWVAIVEVKGTKGGAKETEVQNFGRWAERFILDERRPPSARWFVTNHQRATDPAARQAPFANKSAVVSTFAKSDGTVIDTRALFDMLKLVEQDSSAAPAVRQLLKSKPTLLVRVTRQDLESSGAP